eukprot:2113420-Lingulodinium_polyedra.AAC.1
MQRAYIRTTRVYAGFHAFCRGLSSPPSSFFSCSQHPALSRPRSRVQLQPRDVARGRGPAEQRRPR